VGEGSHSKNPSAGTRHRRRRKGTRKEGFSAAVSLRALTHFAAEEVSLDQDGTRPQRKLRSTRMPSRRPTTGASCVGQRLKDRSKPLSRMASNASAMASGSWVRV
jgi:hypothetical protein